MLKATYIVPSFFLFSKNVTELVSIWVHLGDEVICISDLVNTDLEVNNNPELRGRSPARSAIPAIN